MSQRIARARSVGVEALATIRAVARIRPDLLPVLPHCRAGDDVVVLVHGFLATAGVFRHMRVRLEQEANARVATFSHAPGLGVKRIARQLGALVDRIPRGTRIHLVGHSLGGIVARWYVQEMGGHTRVAQTISLATPFGGAPVAARLPVLVGGDLRPASAILARLRANAYAHDVAHTSIAGSDDRMVFPESSARFPRGESFVLEGRGHNALILDDAAIDLVVERVMRDRLL